MARDRSFRTIHDLPTDALLADLQAGPAESSDPASLVRKWVKLDGIYPGSRLVPSRDLWDRYRAWFYSTGGSRKTIMSHITWGRIMAGIFKAGRTRKSRGYYVSYSPLPEPQNPASGTT